VSTAGGKFARSACQYWKSMGQMADGRSTRQRAGR
jgi:hypothetical protein